MVMQVDWKEERMKAWENTGALVPKSSAIIVLSILSAICRHVNLPFQVPQCMTE